MEEHEAVVSVWEVLACVNHENQGDDGDDEEREEGRGEGCRCCYPATERVEGAEEVQVVMVSRTVMENGLCDAYFCFHSLIFLSPDPISDLPRTEFTCSIPYGRVIIAL